MRFIDLQEGPNDPGIFKAVFLAGGPGSGKSYVAQQLGLQARGLKVLNSDEAFEYLMRKRDLSFDMPPEQQPERDAARQTAKDITKTRQGMYLNGRLGLIIDGTAKDPGKMAKLKAELEAIGYQTMMVFVNTSLRTALQRNLLRDRKVPSDIVVQSHKLVQANKDKLADVFAPNYVEVNNDDNPNFNEPLKRIEKFIDAPITAQARDWVSKASVQKSITQENAQGKPKVYVDMDGVIANFYAGVTAATGHEEPRAMALQDIEDTMASFKGTDFFFQLPKYDQADKLIALVNQMTGGDWYILSSPLKYDREGSAKHKAAWVKKYLKIQPKDMHFTSDKAQYAKQADGTPNILIDDYPKYLNSWKDKGGIGVQYKGHVGNIGDVKATLDKYLGDEVEETIRKVKGGYRLVSKKGKNLGTYPSKSGAEKRERQVQYFKHMGETVDIPRSKMPQINLNDIEEKYNYKKGFISIDKLIPSQSERLKLKHDEAVEKITSGNVKPIMLDKKLYIVNGHHRYDVYKELGYTKVPVIIVDASLNELIEKYSHMSETSKSTAVEPDPSGYQHSLLTAPQNTIAIDKSDDMDFYKLGQHFANLANYNPHEMGVGPSDIMLTLASPEELERVKRILDKLGVKYKDISGSHEEPEIHTKENFADGKKPGRKGLAKRSGVDCSKSETELRKIAKNSSGEKQRMAHWCANMKGGKK